MTKPPSISVPHETWDQEKDDRVLLIAVRVDAASAEEAGRLTNELREFLSERSRDLRFLRHRPDSGSMGADLLLISMYSVVFLPGLISRLMDWKRRHGVSLTLPDVCVSGLESGPYQDRRQVTVRDGAQEPIVHAPPLGELLPRVHTLNQKLAVLEPRAAALGLKPLGVGVPSVSLADEDTRQFPLSDRQRQVVVSMLEGQEHAVQLYERLCDESERLSQRLKAQDEEIDRLLQEGQARVRELLAEADALKARGDLESALDCYQSILPMSETLAEEGGANQLQRRRELAALLWTLGTLKSPANPRKARRQHLARALQLTVKLEAAGQLAGGDLLSSRKIRKALQSLP